MGSNGLFGRDAIPALERTMAFAERRQAILAHNVANIMTPGFQPIDLPEASFREALGRSVDRRREVHGRVFRPLTARGVREGGHGRVTMTPVPRVENTLRYDGNNVNIESLMKDEAKNTLRFLMARQFLTKQYGLMEAAIRGRL